MKFYLLAAIALSNNHEAFATPSAALRRILTVVDDKPETFSRPNKQAQVVDTTREVTPVQRYLKEYPCPAGSTVLPDGSISTTCKYQAWCECKTEYSVREDLSGTGAGCYHCAKPDGANCIEDFECGFQSTCLNNKCGALQCPNTATVSGPMTTSQCALVDCECSANGEYSVKETLDLNGVPCYHCAKPDGASCEVNHECQASSICNADKKCDGNSVKQCPMDVVFENGKLGSMCTQDACECTTGEYTVKQDISGGGCYHCSKPNGASCSSDDECLFGGTSKCLNGKCDDEPPKACPLLSNGYCTTDSSCVCDAASANPKFYVHTFQSGLQCYACTTN